MRRTRSLLIIILLAAAATAGSIGVPSDTGLLVAPGAEAALPNVHEEVTKAALAGETQVVVAVVDRPAMPHVAASLGALELEHHAYDELAMVAIVLPAALAETVARLPGVESVWPNEVMRAYLDQSAEYVGADIVWDTYRVTGGPRATNLIVDSGVDGTHPDTKYGRNLLENVVPAPKSVGGIIGGYQEGVRTSDTDGHGTHVASIAGGTGRAASPGAYRGIAHGAKLVGFQAGVTDAEGDVRFESVTVLEAFNYALKKQDAFDLRVVTNAWGTEGDFEPDNPVNQATFQLYQKGFVVVFAAGNKGELGPGNLNKYCVAPWVLCVTAGDYMNQRASFAAQGTDPAVSGKAYDHPDIMAPGVQITAARPAVDAGPAGGRQSSGQQNYYTTKSGTSMATPHAAGAAALLLGANPRLSPDEVYDLLVSTATPLPGQPVWSSGAGYLNILDAARTAKDMPGTLAWFLDGHMKYGGRATGDREFTRDPVAIGLGQGEARAATGSDVPPQEFVQELTTTPMGLVFLVGSLVLAGAAFGNRRLMGF